jgi:hypothetical protein
LPKLTAQSPLYCYFALIFKFFRDFFIFLLICAGAYDTLELPSRR